MWDHVDMPPSRPSIHLRLPRDLQDELRATAERQGISLNTLLATLLAGAVSWKPGRKK